MFVGVCVYEKNLNGVILILLCDYIIWGWTFWRQDRVKCRLDLLTSSGMDSEGSSSMIDAFADHNGVSARFSTSDGLGKSSLYLGGSRNGETRQSSKTLLASSRKGQWWIVWSRSHSLQGNLLFLFYPDTLLSLVDGVLSTWSSGVFDTGLCKRGDQSLKIQGMEGQSQW